MLRKCYISSKIDNMNADDRKKDAKIMGHTCKTQLLNYSKLNIQKLMIGIRIPSHKS